MTTLACKFFYVLMMGPPEGSIVFRQGRDHTWRHRVDRCLNRQRYSIQYGGGIFSIINGFPKGFQSFGGISFLLVLERLAMIVKMGF